MLAAWDEELAEEQVETRFEEGRTAVAPWAAVEVVEAQEEEELEGILWGDS